MSRLDRWFPPLRDDERVVTHAPMNREQQTKHIITAIVAVFLAYVIYDNFSHPNLDDTTPSERCTYHAYYVSHGGSEGACQKLALEAGARDAQTGMTLEEENAFMNMPDPQQNQ